MVKLLLLLNNKIFVFIFFCISISLFSFSTSFAGSEDEAEELAESSFSLLNDLPYELQSHVQSFLDPKSLLEMRLVNHDSSLYATEHLMQLLRGHYKKVSRLKDQNGAIRYAKFSRDGKWMMTLLDDGTVLLSKSITDLFNRELP